MEGSESPAFRESVTRLSSGPRPWVRETAHSFVNPGDGLPSEWCSDCGIHQNDVSVTKNTLDKPSNT